jgi:hypothetical protein
MDNIKISIEPVIGGFIVTYPKYGNVSDIQLVQEVTTAASKAMRIAKTAVEQFSLVTKPKSDE